MKLREAMPELAGATEWIHSQPLSRRELSGATLIHFWSISCKQCKTTMQQVNRIRDRYKADLNVIAVHMPLSKEDKSIKLIKQQASNQHIHQPLCIDNQLNVTNAFHNHSVPAYYLFDAQKELRHYQLGGKRLDLLQKRIERLLR